MVIVEPCGIFVWVLKVKIPTSVWIMGCPVVVVPETIPLSLLPIESVGMEFLLVNNVGVALAEVGSGC